jgi:general stress protein 26
MSDTADEPFEIVRRILAKARTASVTTRSSNGELHSRPLAVIEDDFVDTLWFFTADPSPKTADIALDPDVNVSIGDGKGWLSFSGVAAVSRDQARIDKYWNPWAEAYFEDGRDDPAVALLEVTVSSVHYWDLDKPAAAAVFEVVKGIITRSAPDLGDDGVVQVG